MVILGAHPVRMRQLAGRGRHLRHGSLLDENLHPDVNSGKWLAVRSAAARRISENQGYLGTDAQCDCPAQRVVVILASIQSALWRSLTPVAHVTVPARGNFRTFDLGPLPCGDSCHMPLILGQRSDALNWAGTTLTDTLPSGWQALHLIHHSALESDDGSRPSAVHIKLFAHDATPTYVRTSRIAPPEVA